MYTYEIIDEVNKINKFFEDNENVFDFNSISKYGMEYFIGMSLYLLKENKEVDPVALLISRDYIDTLLPFMDSDRKSKMELERKAIDKKIALYDNVEEDFGFDRTNILLYNEFTNEISKGYENCTDVFGFTDVIVNFLKRNQMSNIEIEKFFNIRTKFEEPKDIFIGQSIDVLALMNGFEGNLFEFYYHLSRGLYNKVKIDNDDYRNDLIDLSMGYFFYRIEKDFNIKYDDFKKEYELSCMYKF